MSTPVVTVLETADVREAEALMANERKSRLVVTDAEGAGGRDSRASRTSWSMRRDARA